MIFSVDNFPFKINPVRKRFRLIFIPITIWLLVIVYFILKAGYIHLLPNSQQPVHDIQRQNAFATNPEDVTVEDYTADPAYLKLSTEYNDLREIDELSSGIYEQIFNHHSLSSVLGKLDLHDRCQLFFKNLLINDTNWYYDIHRNWRVNYNTDKFRDFKQARLEESRNQQERETEEVTSRKRILKEQNADIEEKIRKEYEGIWNKQVERTFTNWVSVFRIFNKCYVTDNNNTQTALVKRHISHQKKVLNLAGSTGNFASTESEDRTNVGDDGSLFEHRVYPWLSFDYPVYEHWTGSKFYQPPNMKTLNKQEKAKRSRESFLKEFKKATNGRGIVLTIPESDVDTTVNLIHLLRALKNELPIQIVSYDDLSTGAKEKLVNAARDDFIVFPQSFDKVSYMFAPQYKSGGLPKQDIWFVNVYQTIHPDFRTNFRRWYNKFLAMMFNSFEEFILLDNDAVLLQNPEYFFNLPGYKSTGAYFYRDRPLRRYHSDETVNFFKSLTPNVIDSMMFDIPMVTNYTLQLESFKKLYHMQEAGLLVLNRDIHYSSFLMILQVNFFEPLKGQFWGDKELFWLGFVMNGDESFKFNSNFAGVVGEVTPEPEIRHRPDGTAHHSKEICGLHPAHIDGDDNHTLAWINSGFNYCQKDVNYEKEFEAQGPILRIDNVDAFTTFYKAPLKIKQAIVPPLDPEFKQRTNRNDEPSAPWINRAFCKNYMYCAYSSIGGVQKDGGENYLEGKFIEYAEWEQDLFQYYGDIWVGVE